MTGRFVPIAGCIALIVGAGCGEPGGERGVPGVDVSMTEPEVIERIGSPTEARTDRFFSRDSALWSLSGSSSVPARVGSFTGNDAELSGLVSAGDTVSLRVNIWNKKSNWPWQPSETWFVNYRMERGAWRVVSTYIKNDTEKY